MLVALLTVFIYVNYAGAILVTHSSPDVMAYGDWIMVGVWIILFGVFLAFIPFYKKSQRRSSSVYIAFIVALAFEMFGIPLSMYIVTWTIGVSLPPGLLWQHTLQQYIGYWGMYIGYALNFGGAILVIQGWEVIHKNYWSKEEGQGKLVTSGVYSVIRHPQYAGFMLITLGLLVHWATIPLLIMWPILMVMYYRLARKEERDMEKEFGNQYVEYKKQTSMFFPLHLQDKSNKFLMYGVLASILLTVFYFVIVSVAESFDHAFTQFITLDYLFIPLIVSFGIEIGLFTYARHLSKLAHQRSANQMASGGISGVSMILCCAHHLTDVAAFVGLTAVTVFLATYQPVFLLIGIVANFLAILTVLLFLQKNALCYRQGVLTPLMKINLSKVRKLAVIGSILILIAAFGLVASGQQTINSSGPNTSGVFTLASKTLVQNGLTIQVTPQPFKYGDAIRINMQFTTHVGGLDSDLTQAATLQDNNGTTYQPTKWTGPSLTPLEHHISGTLNFPPLNGQPTSIKLILINVYGLNWAFEWSLTP